MDEGYDDGIGEHDITHVPGTRRRNGTIALVERPGAAEISPEPLIAFR
jgi:hypothetical protein